MPAPSRPESIQRLSTEHIEALLRTFVRQCDFARRAFDVLDPQHFITSDEFKYRAVLESAKDLINENGWAIMESPRYRSRLEHKVIDFAESFSGAFNDEDAIWRDLFGPEYDGRRVHHCVPDEAESEADTDEVEETDYEQEAYDSEHFDGELYLDEEDCEVAAEPSGDTSAIDQVDEAVHSVSLFEFLFDPDAELLDVEYGLQLLGRLILERAIYDDARRHFDNRGHEVPGDIRQYIRDLNQRLSVCESITVRSQTLQEAWDAHEAQLDEFRGRDLLGLRTGIENLDRRTLGARGLIVLGAPPNVGKTALAIQIALGVCRHHASNNAIVVIVSLDMPSREIITRIKCNLAHMDAADLCRGSRRNPQNGSFFSSAELRRLRGARQRVHDEQIGSRLLILDRTSIDDSFGVRTLQAHVRELKNRAGASRALVIVDYFQILPLPANAAQHSELEQDRFRIQVLQQLRHESVSTDNPDGDAVLFISETRKPQNQRERWGDALSELMGSARLAYAPDCALIYKTMTDAQIAEYYGCHEGQGAAERTSLEEAGISPVMLHLVKGRDGMTRGQWGMAFHFRQSRFSELTPRGLQAGRVAEIPRDDEPNCATDYAREAIDADIGL